MPQKQTLVTFNTQNLNATDIDHFFNIDESYIEKYRTIKCMYKPNLFMFVRLFILENNGIDNNIT